MGLTVAPGVAARIAALAGGEAFPAAALALLERRGALAAGAVAGPRRPPAAAELGLVRSVAAADASVARIVDGHLNAVERIAVQAPEPVRSEELAALRAGHVRAGVWGADPAAGEGEPAALHVERGGLRISGVKTFCSGAGGLQRALVTARDARDPDAAPRAAWVDLEAPGVHIDRDWFRAGAMRASHSHRVELDAVPVVCVLGGPGALVEQPWLARDALRTAACWAGSADAITAAALDDLARRPADGLTGLAAGRLEVLARTRDLWLAEAARRMDARDDDLPAFALAARVEIARACTEAADVAARACGTGLFARDAAVDRARRDLELFVGQHRLDPLLARVGAALLEARG